MGFVHVISDIDIAGHTTRLCKPGASKATMSFLFDSGYYEVGKNGVSPFQNMHFHLCPIESRLEVIMQTNSLKGNSISTVAALKELSTDMAKFGLAGIFRGQGIGIAKAIVSLTLFHEGRIFITNQFKQHNLKKLEP
jgi:hypothetical protein